MIKEVTLLITAGSGPKECEFASTGIARAYMREAKAYGLQMTLLDDQSTGSNLLVLSGERVSQFLEPRCGSIKWISPSPFRKNHRRKNWFVGVYKLPEASDLSGFDPVDVSFTACRASGPGGQHVNKTNSAVRAVHIPSGVTVTAQENRSQFANKKLCLIKLSAHFSQMEEARSADKEKSIWENHKTLERGNPVRVYEGPKFKLRS